MKSKITKIQILKNGVIIMLAMLLLLTPIVQATTSLNDPTTPETENPVPDTPGTGSTGTENSGTNNSGEEEPEEDDSGEGSGLLNWKELFKGKVGTAADDIKKKIAKNENGANKPGIIEIENEIQLRAIAEIVNNGENNFENITIILTKDIVINNDVEWTPIGIDNSEDANKEDYYDRSFQGNFIGCELDAQGKIKDPKVGKRISNLEYLKEGKTYKELINIGLFGVIGENATIQNIIFDNFNINILYDNSDIVANSGNSEGYKNTYYYNVGNIAGINYGTIKNCFNLSNIKGGSCVGGLVGVNYGTITSCTNAGVVIGYDFVGGITGINYGTIGYTKNINDVKGAESDIGGIAGAFRDGKEIILSHNIGNVEGKTHVGGIVGGTYSENGSIKYCMNEGKITYDEEDTKVYGILGNMYDIKDFNVEDCIVIGTVETLGDANKAAYLRKLTDDNKYNKWGYKVENGIEYKYFDNGYWDNSIGQVQEIQEIKYNDVQVYILSGNRDTDTKGNVIYNPKVVGTGENYNEFDKDGNSGFDIGAGLDVDVENKDDEEQPQEPTESEKLPGEIEITELFSKKEINEGEEDKTVSGTTVSYIVKKIVGENETEITGKGYFKSEETISIIATFNKYLSDEKGFEVAPTLEMVDKDGNSFKMEAKNISRTALDFTTKVEYVYEVKDGDNFEVNSLKLSGCEGIKAQGKSDIAIGENKEVKTDLSATIIADTIAPTLKAKVYVINNLETRRYNEGKVIIFEVTVSEAVNDAYTAKPLIQVNFSESGKGLYNYYIENGVERVGVAKFRSDLTSTELNEDGTVTWVYSYQIQEGDEGELEPEYLEYQIVDFAGNETSSKAANIGEDVTGNNWENEDLNVSIEKIYTTNGDITTDTVLTNEDTLFIDVEFDKALYASIGSICKEDYNYLLKEFKDKAPTLYLNGIDKLAQTNIKEIKEKDSEDGKKSTIVTYEYNLGKIISDNKLDKTLRIRKVLLKNDANNFTITNGEPDGRLAYSEVEKTDYLEADIDLYGIIAKDAVKEIELKNRLNVNPNENVFEIVYDYIYADTTLPTVQITTDTIDPTNAKEIIYTFKFSEYVKGFTEDDITVNGGDKATRINEKGNEEVDFTVVKDGYEYTLKVIPTIPVEKEGNLQVIVEKGVCLDLVAKENVRQEKNITIDRVKPTYTEYSVETKQNEETGRIESIIVTTIFSEGLSETSSTTLVPNLTIDGKEYKGTLDAIVEGNKIKYVYNTNAAEGGEVEISLNGTVIDKAGNESEEISIEVEKNITLEQVRIKDNNEANVYYTFSYNGSVIDNYTNPTYFKAGDKVTVTKYEEVEGQESKKTDYMYEITEGIVSIFQSFNGGKPVQIPFMLLIDSEVAGVAGTIEFALNGSNYINISEANIYFDVIAPSVTLSVEVEEKNADNIYKEGKELIITATTSEAIKNADSEPEIKVGFTNSGSGKYNNGIAKYVETITNEDGTTTWRYKYVAQDGDDGKVVVEYKQNGIVTDLAGNSTTLKTLPDVKTEIPNITDNEISEKEGGTTKVSYQFYKKAEKENEYKEITGFAQNTYFANGDTIKVVAKFDKLLYSTYTDKNRIQLNENDLSKDLIDGLEGEISVSHNDEKETTTITYIYKVKDTDKEEKLNNITLKSNKDIYSVYTKENEITDEQGNTTKEYTIEKGTISSTITKDITACNLWIYNSTTIVSSEELNVDTVRPRVSIKPDVGNVTNSDRIIYTLEFSEEVVGFTEDDITVSGGVKGSLVKVENKNEYQLEVIPDVAQGDNGTVKVVIQENACKDKAGLENVRAESEVRVDRELPDFTKFVIYAPTESNIKLSEEVNAIKQYYTAGDTLKIVAAFSESITTEAKPVILFGGKTAKGTLTQENKIGNNITYTYTIADGDAGELTIGAFNGSAVDAAGNGITLSNRPLVGDKIIADTIAPKLNKIEVVSPEPGVYKAGQLITIETIYDEEVYVLNDKTINLIKSENAPILKIKFGNGDAVDAVASGYGKKTDGSEDRTKLIYTYTIRESSEEEGKEYAGDNGALVIYAYGNKEESKVCDIAGNKSGDVNAKDKQSGNQIIADTKRPEVIDIKAEVEKSTISNTDIYYKAGNKVKITLEFNEKISSAKVIPEILVGFSEDASVEPQVYNTQSYESDWNVDSTTIEYTYTIQDGDNGYLWVKVPEGQFKDEAGNVNVEKVGTRVQDKEIYADTTAPVLPLYENIKINQFGQQIIIKAEFSEDLYWVSDNIRIALSKENAPKMLYLFEGNKEYSLADATSVDGNIITYEVTYEDTVDAKFDNLYFKGNVYDRAGNPAKDEDATDTIAPKLVSVEILNNAGKYSPYCKEGTEIYVIATFDESIQQHNMKLKAKIGNTELSDLSGVIIEENRKQIKYTYTVKTGDNGLFEIVDVCGETDSKITEEGADSTYGWVRDNQGNRNIIYSLSAEGVIAKGTAIADTKKPYIARVEVKTDDTETVLYTKEEGQVAIQRYFKTNASVLEYVITFSEDINYKEDKVEDYITKMYNGIISSITENDLDKDGYCNEIIIRVQPTVEGVQSLLIPENIFEDRAGNENISERFNLVTTDFTIPEVTFISEYNGGTYVIPENLGNITIRPNVKINEDINKIEYSWDEEPYKEIENYSASSDIAIPVKTFTEAGTYKLNIKVTDLAGNVSETSKTYNIVNGNIRITLSTEDYTNQPVTVTINFGEGLEDNRKVTFKAEGSDKVIELMPNKTNENGGIEYIIEENGTIYAEATDRVNNKVSREKEISNIDTEDPVVEIALNGANLVIGTGKEKATIKTDVEVKDNNFGVEAKYAILAEDIDIENITSEQRAKISNVLETEAKIENAESTKGKTPYYLYVIATDVAGNETIVKSRPFTVLDTNERKKEGEESTIEKIPAEITVDELIKFIDEEEDIKDQAFVSIEYKEDIIEERIVTLEDETYGYINEYNNYVELYGNTKVKVEAWDACGNRVYNEHVVDDIVGPEFTIYGNPDHWTNEDVELSVYCDVQLKELTVNGKDILSKLNVKITEYGNYTFKATDIYNNTSEQTIEVKIDKSAPEITEVRIESGKIVIVANDKDKDLNRELSGLKEYAITDTTEVPVEWSSSNEIGVTKDRKFYAWAKDNAGNITCKEQVMIRDITPPELTLTATPSLDKWTSSDIRIDISVNEELESLVVRYKTNVVAEDGTVSETDKEENLLGSKTYVITQNNDYEFIAVDKSGNETKETIKVAKIDKTAPIISKVETSGKTITVTAEDDLSGVVGYAITDTTEEPVEWDKSNKIEVISDGTFYVWIKDSAGHVVRAQEVVVVDTAAPTITFNYTLLTVEAGFPIETEVITNEKARISYSWDEETWVDSEELLTSVLVSKECKTTGKYVLYAKATDKAGNVSKAQIEFNVTKQEEIDDPEIIFEDLPTIQVDGIHYVKVAADMTIEDVTNKMNKDALCGLKPEYINLIDNDLKTGSEITLAGDTKYIVVVNGDVNCDGKVGPIDVTYANSIRLNKVNANIIQKLAADFDLDGIVKPIDITMINSYRLGKIKGI